MHRGRINGIPVWISKADTTFAERTVIREAPGVDGASVEVQGQAPPRYRIDFTLIKDGEWITDDVEVATLDLRSMFLAGGPFTLSAPTIGELTDLWLSGDVNLTFFDEGKLRISSGSLTFIEASPGMIIGEDPIAAVESAVAALSFAAINDFGNRVPTGLSPGALARLRAFNNWALSVQGLIAAAFGPINAVSAGLQLLRGSIETLMNLPKSFASQLMQTLLQLFSLIPSLSKQGDKQTGSAAVQDLNDKPTSTLATALGTGVGFDSDLPPLRASVFADNPSAEDLAEYDEVQAVRLLCYSTITTSAALAITASDFPTVQSVLTVADAFELPFEEMFAVESIDYRSLAAARDLRTSTRRYLAQQAAALPRLRSYTTPKDTDVFSLLPVLYEQLDGVDQVQAAVDSLLSINAIYDGTMILAGTQIRYLDRLT